MFQKMTEVTVCLAYPTSEFLSKVTKSFAINLSQTKISPNILIMKLSFIAPF